MKLNHTILFTPLFLAACATDESQVVRVASQSTRSDIGDGSCARCGAIARPQLPTRAWVRGSEVESVARDCEVGGMAG